jgi:hypothetical protein
MPTRPPPEPASAPRRVEKAKPSDRGARDLLQDPLPEGNWLFRRWYVFSLTGLLLVGLGATIALTPREDLLTIAGWILALIALIAVIYLVAPSAAELGRTIVQLPVWRLGRPPPSEPDQ